MAIVADSYELVIGIDTHAASHILALITAGTGSGQQTMQFPAGSAGLGRAVGWAQRMRSTPRRWWSSTAPVPTALCSPAA